MRLSVKAGLPALACVLALSAPAMAATVKIGLMLPFSGVNA